MSRTALHDGLSATARLTPSAPALVDMDGTATSYADLDGLAGRTADMLCRAGVITGDRVVIHLPKSVDSVAAIVGALRAGAVYVPVDPRAPSARAAAVVADCAPRVVITTATGASSLRPAIERPDARPELLALPQVGLGRGLDTVIGRHPSKTAPRPVRVSPDDPACILYTSGSSGVPKGVVLSHRATTSFVEWAVATFQPLPTDRFASNAPFHFDLSIFDIFVAHWSGAATVLVHEDTLANPRQLAESIEALGMTIWYSTPTLLMTLLDHGHLERHRGAAPRLVLFAGEVFPLPHLRRLVELWPGARFFNLYGPTETNVCTWYEVAREFEWSEMGALPLGQPCPQFHVMVCEGPARVSRGEIGELLVSGPGLMSGYWNLPDATADAFHREHDGTLWYRTGDFVSEAPDGNLLFHGRRDRMIKRRGYRIELAEIEAALGGHPLLALAAVSANVRDGGDTRIVAFVTLRAGGRPSPMELKQYCATHLPAWMIPDRFHILDVMPTTSTGKVDHAALRALAASS